MADLNTLFNEVKAGRKQDTPLGEIFASVRAKPDPYAPPADLPGIPAPKVDMKPVERKWLERGLAAVATGENPIAAVAQVSGLRPKPQDPESPSVAGAIGHAAMTGVPQQIVEATGRKYVSLPERIDEGFNAPGGVRDIATSVIDTVGGRGTTEQLKRNIPAIPVIGDVLEEGAKFGAGLLEFSTSPVGVALPVAGKTAAMMRGAAESAAAMGTPDAAALAAKARMAERGMRGAGAAFGVDMTMAAKDSVGRAIDDSTAKNIAAAGFSVIGAGLPLLHSAGTEVATRKLAGANRAAEAQRVDRPWEQQPWVEGKPVDMPARSLSPAEAGATMAGGQASAEFIQSTVLGEGKPPRKSHRKQTAAGVPAKPFDATEAIPYLPGQQVDMGVRPLGKETAKPFDAFSVIEAPKPKDLGRGITMEDIAAETTRREPAPWPPQPRPPKGERFILPDDPFEAPKVTFEDVVRATEKQAAKTKPEPAPLPLLEAVQADAPVVTPEPKPAIRPEPAPLPLLDAKPEVKTPERPAPRPLPIQPEPVRVARPEPQAPRPINPRRADQAGVLRIPGRQAPAPAAPQSPAVQSALNHFQAEQARADAAKQRPGSTLKEKAVALKNKAAVLFEDQMAPLTRDMKRAGVNVPGSRALPAWKAMDNLIDKSLRSLVIASLEFERAGLKRIIDNASNNSALSQYVIARHARTLNRLGIETGRNAAADARSVAALRNEIAVPERGKPGEWDYQPAMTYEQVGKAVTDFNNGLMDQYARSGLITPELAAELKARYPHYAPVNRILEHMTDPEITGLGPINNRAVASVAAQHLIKKIKGSEAPIENPFEMTMARTEQAFADITRNDAARFFTTMAESTPELKGLVRRLNPGENIPDARKVSLFENGQKVEFETTPEAAAAAKVLNVPQLGMAIKIAAAFSRVKKVGTTGVNFGFFAVNIARDPYDIFINADRGVGARAALDPRIAAKSAKAATHDWPTLAKATKGKLGGQSAAWDELVRGGGGFTEFDLSRQQVAEAIVRNRKDLPSTPQQKVKNTVYRASQAWRTMENHFSRSEQLSRMRLYEATKAKALADGASMAEAKQLAVWESNNVLPNYLRGGQLVRAFSPALPYFNAKIQGARVMRRSLMDRPVETSAKIATAVIMPTIASVVWNMSDPERRKAYMDMPEDEKTRSLIWIYGDATKDSRGRYENAFKMPLSAGAAYLGAPFRRAVEALFIEDEHKGMAFAKEFMGTVPAALTATFTPLDPKESALGTVVSPAMSAQVIAPSAQVWMNHDLYRDAPIESAEMQQLPPAERAYDWTSGTAKTIARDVLPTLGINTSPAKVDAWLYYTFGGAVQYAIAASDAALKAAGEIPEATARGGRTPVGEVEARFKGVRSGKLRSDQFKLRREIKDVWSTKFIREMEASPDYATYDRETKRALKNRFARKAEAVVKRLTDSDGYKAADDADKVKALKQMIDASKREVQR